MIIKSLQNIPKLVSHTLHKSSYIINKQIYTYISPIDKPILSLSLKSFHQLSSQIMTYSFIQSSTQICPQLSIFIGAFVFKIGIQFISTFIKSFKFANKNKLQINNNNNNNNNNSNYRDYVQQRYKNDDRLIIKLIDKIFILDTVRDMQFYGIVKQDINRTIWKYYNPSAIFSSMTNLYLCMNFLRGAHLIISSQQFTQFCSSTLYLSNLSIHDPLFITPIFIIFANYALLKTSRHPLLINLNNPNNIMHCFNIAFMGGLIFVPLPGIYHFAYLGLIAGHLTIRFVRYMREDLQRNMRKFIK